MAQANSTAQQAQRAQGPRQLRPHPLSPICPVQRGENMCTILCEKTSPWDIKISNIVAFMIIVITCTISYNLQALLLDIISLMLFVLVFTYISCSLYIYILYIYILYIYIILYIIYIYIIITVSTWIQALTALPKKMGTALVSSNRRKFIPKKSTRIVML